MSRARLIGALLALIVLACIVVIVLDQRGFFGGQNPSPTPSPTWTVPTPDPAPEPAPADGGGYGDL
ncbi:hypothetical protein ACINK0_16850 [Deinococcus sp. VB343]|uniref:Uncharacterized protein n=1 Tax=Deinococcus sp. VB142 TaxID=3112952 RepID=A0AAU6Q6Y9_9DEIO